AGFLALGLFSQAVHNNSHNEQMYVAAGYLLNHSERLYQDFAFVQTPYTPLIYALAFRLSGGFYLLTAKLVNFGFFAVAAALIYLITRRETRDMVFSLTLLALFLANYYLLRTVIEASNYTIPMACSLGAYYLFVRSLDSRRRSVMFFLAGVLLAVAVGAKLYYATLAVPFGLAALAYPRRASLRSRIGAGALPLVAGTVAGALPLLYYAARDWDRFAFNNLGYHLLNAQWREANGSTATMTWSSKLDTARDLLANPSYLLIVAWLALAVAVVLAQQNKIRRSDVLSCSVVLSGLLTATALLTAFTPRPLFPQYFAMPIPFALALMAALYAQMLPPYRRTLRQSAVIAAILVTITVLPRHTGSLRSALQGDDRWAGTEAVEVSRFIRDAIETSATSSGSPGKILTLSPVYAIESDLPIYPELATGSFVFRIGDLLSQEERERYHATSVSTISDLLDADPPAAILIGDEGDLETPLLDFAQTHNYVPYGDELAGGRLFIR
ncbi:MAG: glycosyltransferase family 39 protein, partial [Caldilineaceae bacterium]